MSVSDGCVEVDEPRHYHQAPAVDDSVRFRYRLPTKVSPVRNKVGVVNEDVRPRHFVPTNDPVRTADQGRDFTIRKGGVGGIVRQTSRRPAERSMQPSSQQRKRAAKTRSEMTFPDMSERLPVRLGRFVPRSARPGRKATVKAASGNRGKNMSKTRHGRSSERTRTCPAEASRDLRLTFDVRRMRVTDNKRRRQRDIQLP